jgi:hypothetical protein
VYEQQRGGRGYAHPSLLLLDVKILFQLIELHSIPGRSALALAMGSAACKVCAPVEFRTEEKQECERSSSLLR